MKIKNLLGIFGAITIVLVSLSGAYLTYAYFNDDIDLFNETGPGFVNQVESETALDMPDNYRELRYRPERGIDQMYKMRFKLKEEYLNKFLVSNNLSEDLSGEYISDFPCYAAFSKDDPDIEWWQPTQIGNAQCAQLKDETSGYYIYIYFGTYSWEEEKTLLIYMFQT